MVAAASPTAAQQPRSIDPATVGHRFRDALTKSSLAVIAEIKRRSPSRGTLRAALDPAETARAYERGGASCLSVLTDPERFGGSPDDLRTAKAAVAIPVLRKDFLRSAQDVHASVEMGADAVLAIVPDIGADQCRRLQDLALTLGMDVVTEVRDEAELEAAVTCGAYMIAVNQRNNPRATDFTVDYGQAVRVSRMFDQIDPAITKIAASGIGVEGGTPIEAIADAGYDAALIGEALVTAQDPAAELELLVSRCR